MTTGREFAHAQERPVIRQALEKHHGNIMETARVLKIPYSTLNYKIRVLGLKKEAAEMRAHAVLQGLRVVGRKPKRKKTNSRPKKRENTERISPQAIALMNLATKPDEDEEE